MFSLALSVRPVLATVSGDAGITSGAAAGSSSNGVITEEQLAAALSDQKKTGQKLGKALVGLDYIDKNSSNWFSPI